MAAVIVWAGFLCACVFGFVLLVGVGFFVYVTIGDAIEDRRWRNMTRRAADGVPPEGVRW